MRFRDRDDAGRQLAAALLSMELQDPVVLGLPRGGVPVAAVVADRLGATLDVVVARKIGAPGHPEYGIGAVAEGGGAVVDQRAVAALGISPREYDAMVDDELEELERRVRRYRGERPLVPIRGRDVVVVDDGLATGVTARAALQGLRGRRPASLILAVPVCAQESVVPLGTCADRVVCVLRPGDLRAVGAWYDDFRQVDDDQVCEALHRSARPASA